jgi:AcrR family transcriptional regulator
VKAESIKKTRGRPRAFDPETALEKGMQVFWAYGYDATSVEDLTAAMGIHRPSFYRTFGDKEELFLRAVDHYLKTRGRKPREALDQHDEVEKAVLAYLLAVISNATGGEGPAGCLIANMLAASAPTNPRFMKKYQECLANNDARLEARLVRGVGDGQLSPDTDTTRLAQVIGLTRQGLAARGCSGASANELNETAELAVRLLFAGGR